MLPRKCHFFCSAAVMLHRKASPFACNVSPVLSSIVRHVWVCLPTVACGHTKSRQLSTTRISRSSVRGLPSVAPHAPQSGHALHHLQSLVSRASQLLVITGAGVSTESGIPDYRSPRRRPSSPISFQDFVKHPAARQRYWARNFAAYSRFVSALPNPTHYRLARMEHTGKLSGLVTQNVDGLHSHAGSQQVVQLHGSLSHVECMACATRFSRQSVQAQMLETNGQWAALVHSRDSGLQMKPDGDTELPLPTEGFRGPRCANCSSDLLKPAVVFFGENVPRHSSERATAMLNRSDAVLILGSSMTVWSGFRLARLAAQKGLPIGIVNIGETRADALAAVKVDGLASDVMKTLVPDA